MTLTRTKPAPLPPANPLWRRAPVRVSPNGRSAWVDAMLLHDIAQHYRIFKVNEGGRR